MKSNKKIRDLDTLGTLTREVGKKVVHCHGVFDVLHAGHLAYFESAKKFGDTLVVTITADQFVNKGPGRPYFGETVRAAMIAALEIVDFVAVSKSPTAVAAIEKIAPDFYVKGPDYRDKAADPTGAIFDEEAAAEKGGGRLVFTDDATHSSSSLINLFFPVWSDDQQAAIAEVKKAGGLNLVQEVLAQIAKEEVLVVGEPIVDTYVFVRPESISSKSPSVSAKFLYEENYAGGSLAIANHLSDFVKSVSLLITHGGEPYFEKMLKESMDPRIEVIGEKTHGIPTPRKTRFLADDKVQRLFELTDLRSDQWNSVRCEAFSQKLKEQNKKATTTILADFGHGIFEGDVLESVSKLEGFLALNVQTNSSNFPFNPFTKHKNFSFLSIDLKEARIAYQDRFSSHLDLVKQLSGDSRYQKSAFAMTLGPHGSYFVPVAKRQEIKAPAFADSVVDALGAGDAFFSLASLLVKIGAPDILVPFLGNIFAGLKTKIIGNKTAVTRAQFLKAVTSILK